MKGTIIKLSNDKSFLWYGFKPEILSLKLIDDIRYTLDEYKEPKVDYNSKDTYKKQLPNHFGYHDGMEVYAIMICEPNLVNYVLIKSHPLFKKVDKMVYEKFKFAIYKKNKKP